jgi:hypothetical protein
MSTKQAAILGAGFGGTWGGTLAAGLVQYYLKDAHIAPLLGAAAIGGLIACVFTACVTPREISERKPVRIMKLLTSLALALPAFLCASHALAAELLTKIADIPLPGAATRFDYASIDPAAGRLYFSHMGDGKLMVFDTKAEKLVTNLPGFPTMTGVLVVPSLHRVYGSVTKNHEVAVVDTDTLAVLKRIPAGKFPDGLAFSPETKKLFVSDESGGVDTVIDTATNQKLLAIPLGGEAGNTQYDPTSRLIYVAVQTRNQFVAIDPQTDAITARYDLKMGHHPHGFYIDAPRNRAYISCQEDNKLIVFNLESHREEQVFPVESGPDVLAFDSELNLLYVACEAGSVSMFKAGDGKLTKLGDAKVGFNSHTVAVDSKSHKAYFPLKKVNGFPALRIMTPNL